MGKFLPVLLLFLTFCASAFAQPAPATGTVKGIVADSASAEAVVFATVSVREPGKTEPFKIAYTGDQGEFQITGLPLQPCEVVISFVGFQTKVIPVKNLSATNTSVNLGKISLPATGKKLETVEVTGEKLLIKQDIDKLSYEVEADPESKTLNALDMLRKVPLITVDGQDKIELKGSTNYKILVNGKASGLFARDPAEVFKSMPASSILRIEVITEPSAKYDAEGVGGIINIITAKQGLGGYNGSLSVRAGLPENYSLSGYGTVKTGKFGASVNFGNNLYTRPEAKAVFRRTNYLNGGSEFRQDGVNDADGAWRYFTTELSFELDSLNLLTGEISLHGGGQDNRLRQLAQYYTGTGELLQSYYRRNTSEDNWHGSGLAFDYQRSFANKPERLLTLSYKFDGEGSDALTDIALEEVLNFEDMQAQTFNKEGSSEHTAQLDYVHPLGKHTYETGLKTIFRTSNSDYFYSTLNPLSGALEPDPALSNRFNYRQDIFAAYSSASFRKDKWGLKVGLRLEETRINANFSTSETKAKQEYLNLIPSVALSRKFGQMDNLKLSYNQRIERPWLWYLNPYVNLSDPRNISYGNPDLRPVISHNLDLSYNTFIKTASIGGSLFYNYIDNSIQEFTVLGADSVSRRTYGNIGKNQVTGLSVFGNVTIKKNLSLRLNVSGRYNQISSTEAGFARSNNGLSANYHGGLTYKLGKTWKLSGNGGGSSSRVTLQGRSTGYLWHSLSLSKSFLAEDKLSVIFSANNPFQRTRFWGSEIKDPEFYQLNETHFVNQTFNLSISWRFGKLKEQIAQTQRGINNDDQSGGNSGGGAPK